MLKLWTKGSARCLNIGCILLLLVASCTPQETSGQTDSVLLRATISALETQAARPESPEPTLVPTEEPVPTSVSSPTPQEIAPSPTLEPSETIPSPTALPTQAVRARGLGMEKHHCPEADEKLGQFAAEKGWVVEELDVEPLTEAYLTQKQVSILAIQNNTVAFTESELREIESFVEHGGGLLLQADQQRSRRGWTTLYAKDIARIFGVSIDGTPVAMVDVPVQSDHPLLQDVTVFSISSNNDEREPVFLNVGSPAYVVLSAGATEPYKPVLAAAEVGSGRVVIYPTMFNHVSDVRPYEAWSLGDNLYFLRNALYWLQQEDLP